MACLGKNQLLTVSNFSLCDEFTITVLFCIEVLFGKQVENRCYNQEFLKESRRSFYCNVLPHSFAIFLNLAYLFQHKHKTLNPHWLEQFDLRMYQGQTSHLEIVAYDHDVGRDDFMGR